MRGQVSAYSWSCFPQASSPGSDIDLTLSGKRRADWGDGRLRPASWMALSRFLHVDLAPTGWCNRTLDGLAGRGRFELQAIVAALRAVRRILVADRLLRRLSLGRGIATSRHGRSEHRSAAGADREVPQDGAARKRCR